MGRIDRWGNFQPIVPEKASLGLWRAEPGGKVVYCNCCKLQGCWVTMGRGKMPCILERMAPFLFTGKKKGHATKFKETISLQQPVAIRQAIVKDWELRATAWKETAASPVLGQCTWNPIVSGRRKMQSWVSSQPGAHLMGGFRRGASPLQQRSGGPALTKTRGASPLLWPQGAQDDLPFVKNKLGSTDVTLLWSYIGSWDSVSKRMGKEGREVFQRPPWIFGSCSAANNGLSPSHSEDKS